MAVDLSKIAASAIEAALDDGEPKKRKHGSTVKAVAAGAALAVAAKAATSKRTKLMNKLVPTPSLDGLRDIPDRVRDRLADAGWLNDEEDVEDDEPVDEADEDEEPVDEEPVAEDDEEPVDEAEEDWDDDEDDEDFDEDELDDDEEDDEEPPPELEIESEDHEDLHPEDRPPEPPRSKERAR